MTRMADVPVPRDANVSRQMSRMPRRDSTPELRLRSELHRRGLRFRTNVRGLPGTPDIALTRARIAVFCDGCFWHACPEHGALPKNNEEWWTAKLALNRARDVRKDRELIALGWLPLHVWEHEDAKSSAIMIERHWRRRTGRT